MLYWQLLLRIIEWICLHLPSYSLQTVWPLNEVLPVNLYDLDKLFYSSVQLERQQMTSLRDLTIGSLLVNYPTEILSRNPFESVLNRDEILFITDICELGVRGIVLNPFRSISWFTCSHNVRTRTQTIDGKKVNVVSTRQPEMSRKVFVVRDKQLSDCLDSQVVRLNDNEIATVTPDWDRIAQSDASSIMQFDSLQFVPYPYRDKECNPSFNDPKCYWWIHYWNPSDV